MRLLDQSHDELTTKTSEEEIEFDYNEPISVSRRHKIRMNRIFREIVGSKFLPYPEVDNFYEKSRSWIVVKFKTKK